MMPAHEASRSFRSIAFVAAATLLAACGGEPADPIAQPIVPGAPGTVLLPADPFAKPPAKPPPAAPSVSLAFAAAVPAGAFEPLEQAWIDDTPTLYVVADWKNVPVNAVERLDLIMPSGSLYASLELPIGETQRGDLHFQVLADGTRRLTYSLFVWGTPIEMYRITGSWSATATLVGGAASASAGVLLE